jgi:serine/threonine-protein kinase
LIGKTVDRKYKLLRLLGEGGMGSVYEAEHEGTHRRVAVKIVDPRVLSPDGKMASRFRREAKTAGAIDSQHIVQVLDAGEDEARGTLYLVMEHLLGHDLQHLIDRAGPLRPDVALRIVGQALAGLQKAHEAGIIHRDIKPANLFLARRDGEVIVKILDFGLAKIMADALLNLPHTTGLTNSGVVLGSPLYMPPEQAQSTKHVDHRTDLWSLGSTLYCALTGQAPHQHVTPYYRMIIAICASPARPIRERAPWVPPEVEDVIRRALAIRPEERCPSAATMIEALRPIVPGGFALREEMLVGMSPEELTAAPISLSPLGRTTAVEDVDGSDLEVVNKTELDPKFRSGC